jgi:hypothetical protein
MVSQNLRCVVETPLGQLRGGHLLVSRIGTAVKMMKAGKDHQFGIAEPRGVLWQTKPSGLSIRNRKIICTRFFNGLPTEIYL